MVRYFLKPFNCTSLGLPQKVAHRQRLGKLIFTTSTSVDSSNYWEQHTDKFSQVGFVDNHYESSP